MTSDLYAGDEAWLQWFDRCAVHLCDEQWRGPLWEEIGSALERAVREKHVRNANLARDYICNYFDAYFKLRGAAEVDKPRKRQIESRIPDAPHGLRGIVLGALMTGEVRTMAREIKTDVDEGENVWRVDPVTGRKRLVVVSVDASPPGTGDDGSASLSDILCAPEAPSADEALDAQWYKTSAERFLREAADEETDEKILAAAAIYVRAYGIPVYRPVVGRLMGGVQNVAAGNKINKILEMLRRFCKMHDICPTNIQFAQILAQSAERILAKAGVLEELVAAKACK